MPKAQGPKNDQVPMTNVQAAGVLVIGAWVFFGPWSSDLGHSPPLLCRNRADLFRLVLMIVPNTRVVRAQSVERG